MFRGVLLGMNDFEKSGIRCFASGPQQIRHYRFSGHSFVRISINAEREGSMAGYALEGCRTRAAFTREQIHLRSE